MTAVFLADARRNQILSRSVLLSILFHGFITFNEYECLTAGRWGTGGCRCCQCMTRVPRVLEFALAKDIEHSLLDHSTSLIGPFGEVGATPSSRPFPGKLWIVLVGPGKRTTEQNSFQFLFAADHTLSKLGNRTVPRSDAVKACQSINHRVHTTPSQPMNTSSI